MKIKDNSAWVNRLAGLCAALTVLLGGLVIIGWYSHHETLIRISPNFVAMVFNTALGLVLSGTALLAITQGYRRMAIPGAILVATLALLTLAEYLLHLNLGIDSLFVDPYVSFANAYPGRMAISTALFFLGSSVGILILAWGKRCRPHMWVSAILGAACVVLGLVGFAGYFTGVATVYVWGDLARMAIHTAFGATMVGTTLLLLVWSNQERRYRNAMSLWIPVGTGLASITIALCMWQALSAHQKNYTDKLTQSKVISLQHEIREHLGLRFQTLSRIAESWEQSGEPNRQIWESNTRLDLDLFPGFVAIWWVDGSTKETWNSQLAPEPIPLDLNSILSHSRSATDEAVIHLTPTFELLDGRKAFQIYVPVFETNQFKGVIVGTQIAGALFEESLAEINLSGNYEVAVEDGIGRIYGPDPGDRRSRQLKAQTDLSFTGGAWKIWLWPKSDITPEFYSYVPPATLVVGFLAALILFLSTRLVQIARRNAQQLQRSNHQMAREIEERKRIEESLSESEQRFRDLFDNASDLIQSVAMDGSFQYVNRSWRQTLGYSEEEVKSLNLFQIIHPDSQAHCMALFEQIQRGEPIGQVEAVFVTKDGRPIQIEGALSIFFKDGKPVAIRSIYRNVTKRKRAEQILKNRESELNEAQRIALIGSWEWDAASDSSRCSDALYDILDRTPDEVGKTFQGFINLIHPSDREYVIEVNDRALREKRSCSYRHRIIRPDGSVRYHDVNLKVGLNEQGDVAKLFGTTQDITERVHLENDLKLARDEALESARLKSQFLANMSHEIRTPMNGVIGMTGLLLDSELSDEQRDYAQTIRDSSEALLTIINDILDFSKIEAGKLQFETVDFDLRNAVEGCLELLADRAREKKIEFASLIHADVPVLLRGDPGRLRQVLLNLMGNALKFTEEGEVVVTVNREVESDAEAIIKVAISDTGIGISEETQKYLFQAFTQADGSTTRKYGGTGLGLSISKHLVEMMGGEIGIISTPGKGSTFWFTARFEKQAVMAKATMPDPSSLQRLRVLIVDDNKTNRKILSQQLQAWRINGEEVDSAATALEQLRAALAQGCPYDLVLTDLMMPEMDGFELARAIKAEPELVPTRVVVLSSNGQRGDGTRASELGIDAYLTKPIRQSHLFDCLTQIFSTTDLEKDASVEAGTRQQLITKHSLKETKGVLPKLILLAEDNLVNQKVAIRQLQKLGFRTDVVVNGREAIDAINRNSYDLILMDCQMPEMDGYEATREIRRLEGEAKHIPIVAMTAHALEGDREKCIAMGMDDYVSKPVRVEELSQVLTRLFNKSTAEVLS